jgi:hypothetical protein
MEVNISPRVSDAWKTCAREIAETFEDSGNVFRNRHAEEECRTWLTVDSVIRRVR